MWECTCFRKHVCTQGLSSRLSVVVLWSLLWATHGLPGDGKPAVPGHVWHQELNEVHQFCCLDHFVPDQQVVVIAEVEHTFRGVSVGESCCCQGPALAPSTIQLDRLVGRLRLGPQWSVLWEKKHSEPGADSLCGNMNVSSQNGQRFPRSRVARHHPQQVDAHAPLAVSQAF